MYEVCGDTNRVVEHGSSGYKHNCWNGLWLGIVNI